MPEFPERLYVTHGRWFEEGHPNPEYEIWTLSAIPNEPGWETDSGCSGYGLTKALADEIARRYNDFKPKQYLLTQDMVDAGRSILVEVDEQKLLSAFIAMCNVGNER